MKLLLTNDELHEVRGGTQVFIMDLALALRDHGHQVAVYAWLRGSLSDELANAGVPVVGAPLDCDFVPDVIHGQHHLAAMASLAAFPGTPAIYHCHGYGPWQERPPVHPRVLTYVGMAHAMIGWLATETKRPSSEIMVLPNSVHLGRFNTVRSPRFSPRRAAVFGNAFVPGHLLSRLRRACERSGIALDFIGEPFGNATATPQAVLPEYDLVFAVGRSALEAMACGCAVMPFDVKGCGPIVQPETVVPWSARNFTVPGDIFPTEVGRVMKEIRRFDPGRVHEVACRIREQFGFDRTCHELEALYARVADAWSKSPPPDPAEESRIMSRYLMSLGPLIKGADQRWQTMREQRTKTRERLARLKDRITTQQVEWAKLRQRLPGFLRRWLLRGIDWREGASPGRKGEKKQP